ncbi:hypothetical protein TNCT_301551 [Trichonephila clavata]|uniref:C2H2-type domain-containing protein n=1 Tax=Trichonephila clavata TaxID=2740835 RepID=A0A8X6JKU5_TRICU|nr:hypothetical protein TNCT_301551 [Trichonephila clavata]
MSDLRKTVQIDTSPSPIAMRTRGIARDIARTTTSCCCLLCGFYVPDIHMLMPHVLQHPNSARRRRVEYQLSKALEAANRDAQNPSEPSAEETFARPTPPLHRPPEEIDSPSHSPKSGNTGPPDVTPPPSASPRHMFAPPIHWVEDFTPTRFVRETVTQMVELVALEASPPVEDRMLTHSETDELNLEQTNSDTGDENYQQEAVVVGFTTQETVVTIDPDTTEVKEKLEVVLTTPPMTDAVPAAVETMPTTATSSPHEQGNDDTASQRSNSPSVLDIIFAGELSQQSEADINDLLSTWQESLTGSPPHRAFGPPTYAATAKLGKSKRATVSKLWLCSNCPKKFYTEKGRDDHEAACQVVVEETPVRDAVPTAVSGGSEKSSTTKTSTAGPKNPAILKQDRMPTASTKKLRAGSDAAPRKTGAKKAAKPQPERTRLVFCKHCDRRIHLATTLEQHYLKKHFRKLSPGTKNASSSAALIPSVTPLIEEHAGKISARRLDGPFRCEVCERQFGSERTLAYHTWNFHKIVPPPKPRRSAEDISRVNAHPRSPPTRSGDHFSCAACSVRNPLIFLTQAALDEHIIQCHTVAMPDAPKGKEKPSSHSSSAVWCPDCASFISQKFSLAEHIKRKHNGTIKVPNRGPTHTEVIMVEKSQITEQTQFHVTCPDNPAQIHGLSDQITGKKPHEGTFVCSTCKVKCKTRKGLTYHRLRDHGASVGRANPRSTDHQDPIVNQDEDATPTAVHTAPTRTGGGSPKRGGAAVLGETLRLQFPLPQVLTCPVANCTHSFHTEKWYTTNTSVKKHLTSYHRLSNLRVEYWCAICDCRIQSKPALHPCLEGVLSVVTTDSPGCNWPCVECGVIFTTKNGLLNHEKYHKRRRLQEKMPKLRVLEGPKARRIKKMKKLAPILTGEPGTRSLAPVTDSPCHECGFRQQRAYYKRRFESER